jgi:hypothetical protein
MAKGGLYGRPERGVLGCADVRFLAISQVVERMAVGYVVDENEGSRYGSTEVACCAHRRRAFHLDTGEAGPLPPRDVTMPFEGDGRCAHKGPAADCRVG